jgi:hypothetical protein
MGTTIYLLYVMGGFICNILLLYENHLLLLYKTFTIVLSVLVYMYCMIMNYFTSCGHLTKLWTHVMYMNACNAFFFNKAQVSPED